MDLDALCTERGWSWRVWEDVLPDAGPFGRPFWRGQVLDAVGGSVAEVRHYPPERSGAGREHAVQRLRETVQRHARARDDRVVAALTSP